MSALLEMTNEWAALFLVSALEGFEFFGGNFRALGRFVG